MRFSLFRRFCLNCFAVALVGSLATSTAFAQDAAVAAPTDLAVPQNASKAELVAFQAKLTQALQDAAPADAERLYAESAAAFYESTKALLALDLTADERTRYVSQLAQIVATFALEEGVAAQKLGPRFDELAALAQDAKSAFEAASDAETAASRRAEYLEYANYAFLVRLQVAQNLAAKVRDEAFMSLAQDAVAFAVENPEYGETAYQIVMQIRAFSNAVGDAALDLLGEEFEKTKNPTLIQPIKKTLGRRRFARLPGSELKLEGLLLENGKFEKKFDWKDYDGKVLLVEFWATWCGPCRREIPILKEFYAKYKDAGFELIGYSIDQDVAKLKSFVVENEIPWPMISQTESVAAGFEHLHDYYAINGVPELILIGRDGKVVLTDARGPKLAAALAELFPEIEPLELAPNAFSTERVSAPNADEEPRR